MEQTNNSNFHNNSFSRIHLQQVQWPQRWQRQNYNWSRGFEHFDWISLLFYSVLLQFRLFFIKQVKKYHGSGSDVCCVCDELFSFRNPWKSNGTKTKNELNKHKSSGPVHQGGGKRRVRKDWAYQVDPQRITLQVVRIKHKKNLWRETLREASKFHCMRTPAIEFDVDVEEFYIR